MTEASGATALPGSSSFDTDASTDTVNMAPSQSTATEPQQDAAASLRAAALMSRKRRKVVPEKPPAPVTRSHVEPSLHLDYGQEDFNAQSPFTPALTHSPVQEKKPLPPPKAVSPVSDIEDGQIREEGEISDEEPPPPAPPPPGRKSLSPRRNLRRSPSAGLPARHRSHRPSISIKREHTPPSLSEIFPPHTQSPAFSSAYTNSIFPLETPDYRLDADHVRPGLPMTQDQFNTAKDAVLDLLGWGVSPEYLLYCGLSRQLIFYVFNELNLRLPDGFDDTGLIHYPTPEMASLMPISPSISMRRLPPTVPPPLAAHENDYGDISSTSHGHRDYSISDGSGLVSPDLHETTNQDAENLHAIELQRKQELQARKAAIASRRRKASDALARTVSNEDDVDMTPPVATETVDDFLKSIEHPVLDDPVAGDPTPTYDTSFDHMEVDEASLDLPSPNLPEQQSPLPSYQSPVDTTPQSFTPAEPELISGLSPPVVLPSKLSRSKEVSAINPITQDANGAHLTRRASKRPVAADFVDTDNLRPPLSSYGQPNGNHTPPPSPLPRKTGSFASISGMRRCVIELSDSEDDGSEAMERNGQVDSRPFSPAIGSGFGRQPLFWGATAASFANGGSRPASASAGNASSGSALLEKEEEIKRMRQMIAEREQLRLKKLAAIAGKMTPTSSLTLAQATADGEKQAVSPLQPITSTAPVAGRQEEDDGASSGASASHPRSPLPTHSASVEREPEQPVSSELEHRAPTDVPARDHPGREPTPVEAHSGAREHSGSRTPSIERSPQTDQPELTVLGDSGTSKAVSPVIEAEDAQSSSAADEAGASSSAQSLEQPQDAFADYDSPFSSYPLLRSQFSSIPASQPFTSGSSAFVVDSMAHPTSDSFSVPSSHSSHVGSSHTLPVQLPDMRPLKQAALQRSLGQLLAGDSGRRVCQYEVPGGGVCRDSDCEDLHLSRLAGDPTDTELAEFIHDALPHPWHGRCDVHGVKIALEGVRLRGGAQNIDEHAMTALTALGIPVSATDDRTVR